MPIKGISDARRLHRLAKIRLGEKQISKKTGAAYPAKLDHFNFKDCPELAALYGENCKEIDIMIPNEDPEVFFPQNRMAYRKTGLFCKGDGECKDNPGVATRVQVGLSDGDKQSRTVPKGQPLDPQGHAYLKEQKLDVATGMMFDLPCLGEDCPFSLNKMCKPIGRFLFMVPKAPRIGVYEISTTSYNTIVELNSAIAKPDESGMGAGYLRGITGRVSMIPLKLKLVPKETKVPRTGQPTTIYHLVLEFAGTLASLMEYRSVPQIGMDRMPHRAEIEREVPEDLVSHGGEDLEAQVGSAAPSEEPHEGKPAGQDAPVGQEEYVPGEDAGEIEGPGLGTSPGAQESREVQGELMPPPVKPAASAPARPAPPAKPAPAAPAGPKKPSRQLFR
jgi:hypothetical protein